MQWVGRPIGEVFADRLWKPGGTRLVAEVRLHEEMMVGVGPERTQWSRRPGDVWDP